MLVGPAGLNLNELESLRIQRPLRGPRPGKNGRHHRLAVLAITVLLASAASSLTYWRVVRRPVPVPTMIVKTRQEPSDDIVLTGSGYIVTRHKYITVGTKVLGQIVEEPIEEGRHINKGDLLARIDDRDYQAQLRQALADRELAKTNLELSSIRAARTQKLYQDGIVSKDELDSSVSAARGAEAKLKHDEAAIDYAEFMVSQCVIRSPINGIVLRKYRELGDTINYGGQLQPGSGATDIAQLADTTDIRAEVDINESDIGKIIIGMPATIVPDAYPDRHFDAFLVKVYPEADRQKATVKVEVQLQKPDLQIIKPEMSVKTSFLEKKNTKAEDGQLVVPRGAVIVSGKAAYVWIVANGKAKRTPVLPGRETEGEVEIRNGLNQGDVIITTPPAGLADGQKVTERAGK
jgi:RND family efflux transporter MFP subunit